MTHKSQLENKKYRNWVKAGLGMKYVKDGLEPFCEYLVTKQHTDILSKVKQKHSLSAVLCGLCDVCTLQPDHIQTKNRLCPLGQMHCNCQHSRGKIPCANKVCSAIYDEIIKLHASTPPAPYWRNTDAQQWCTEPWSVAKCFINAPGYEQQLRADEFDCLGLLHVLMNNIEFQQHIKCGITGTDVLSRVRKSRHEIFHSHTMKLEDTEVNSYIDDMIELLEDETEIKHRQESKDSVQNLLELKQEDFIISTTDEAEIHRIAMATVNEKEKELKQTIVDAGNELENKIAEGKHELEVKSLDVKSELEQTGTKITKELVMKGDEIRATAAESKRKLEVEGLKLEQKGIELEKQLMTKEKEIEIKLEQKLHELENKKTLIEDSMKDIAETLQQTEKKQETDDNRKRGRLIKRYEKYVRKVPSLPLQPKRNQSNVIDVYVHPWMTVEIKDEASKGGKDVNIAMHEIFRNEDNPAKYIYVIGEAGSGKSMFCKILVHFWCIAHSCSECSSDKSDVVKEMGSFEYLFYVSLRHCPECDSIEKMLENLYRDPALGDILKYECDKCLIVLDGLDEWTPERKHNSQFLTQGLPGRDLDSDYTIITTTRQWKFDALQITDNEVDKKIKLRGIDQTGIIDLTQKTVKMLNDTFRYSKSAETCINDLQSRPVSDISHIPLILQQLIFLWFDDKLRDTSKYALYSSMLALFLEWKALQSSENQECELSTEERLIYLSLPDYLCQFDIFRGNARVIQYLSHLAYETLFDKNKETTLIFNRSTLERLNVANDVIKFSLNVGILTEEESVCLHASIRHQSSFSFCHKSIQEYLAAVYVASQLKEMVSSQKSVQKDKREYSDVCKECVLKYFGSCETVVDILEQSNVFIMLCGLEPRLLTNVSEYIYNVATVDKMVVEERNKLPEECSLYHRQNKLIKDIQACILQCSEEVMSNEKNVQTPVYIADLNVSPPSNLERYDKNIILKSVLSIEVDENVFGMSERDKETVYVFPEYLTKCDQLKAIKFCDKYSGRDNESIINAVAKLLRINASTLETISSLEVDNKIISHLVSIIPKMQRLVSLQMTTVLGKVSHEVCLSLSEVLKQATSLQHISIEIECKKYDRHLIDLSKHKQLQHADFRSSTLNIVNCNTDNLETFELHVSSGAMMIQVCNSLYKACKLKHVELKCLSTIKPYLTEVRTVTENLFRLLPSLVSLSTLTLWEFNFTDNIITCPSHMKNLKEIELNSVTMSLTTWCKFVDSLPTLPQSVKVDIYNMSIREETINGYSMLNKKQVADARQYIRGKNNLFRVTRDDALFLIFTTKENVT